MLDETKTFVENLVAVSL